MRRPSRDEVYLGIAKLLAERSTCRRRAVGCLLASADGTILSLGYNGVPTGLLHCLDEPCSGANSASGTNLEGCTSIHSEVNALLRCPDISKIDTCYVTVSPCIHCIKLLLNTTCHRIVFSQEYPHVESKRAWLRAGREWVHLEECDLHLTIHKTKELVDDNSRIS